MAAGRRDGEEGGVAVEEGVLGAESLDESLELSGSPASKTNEEIDNKNNHIKCAEFNETRTEYGERPETQ